MSTESWQDRLEHLLTEYTLEPTGRGTLPGQDSTSRSWAADEELHKMAELADKAEKIPNATFCSDWGGIIIKIPRFLNEVTGEFDVQALCEIHGLDSLEREWIELKDGEEIELCPYCTGYIMKDVMVEGPDNTSLVESKECHNPDCENKS